MRGRKPKPTVIQALHGNPRKHGKIELAERLAIEPTDDTLEVPDYFSPSQLEIWHSAVAHAPPGILRRIDGWALRAWVAACDLHRQAMIAQAKTSLLVQMPAGRRRRDKDGKELPEVATALPQQSPLLGIINRQAIIMLRAAEQMGFTPTSRPIDQQRVTLPRRLSRVSPAAPQRPLNPNSVPRAVPTASRIQLAPTPGM
jgi:hypothetical protein